MVARALERVGDRWNLLVIRDLLTGAKRFTDLMDRLGGITPKTLTVRLRELEEAGIVAVDREPGRREVWYRLTPAGQDLGPVIDGLSWWGQRHAWRRPLPGEPLHAEHLLRSAVRAIEHSAGDNGRDGVVEEDGPARWRFLLDGADYLVESDGQRWSLAAGAPSGPVDVAITGTTQALIALIFSRSDEGIDIAGEDGPVRRFRQLIGTMAATVAPAGETGQSAARGDI